MSFDIRPGDTLSFIVLGWWTGKVDFIHISSRQSKDRKIFPSVELDVNLTSEEVNAESFLKRICEGKGLVATRIAPGYHTYKIEKKKGRTWWQVIQSTVVRLLYKMGI